MQLMVLGMTTLGNRLLASLKWTAAAVACVCAVLFAGAGMAQPTDSRNISRGAYLARADVEVRSENKLSERNISRGAYLAKAGDCVVCHTAGPNRPLYAGGLPINSPFGVIYSTNITPDPEHGIGKYSLEEFSRAVREGIARDGHYLYPAMPYPSFSAITDEDMRDLYSYFMNGVTPVSDSPPETDLPFPFNIRFSLFFWDLAFVKQERFKSRNDRDAQWNRGAYLVQSFGHCGACHTPRGLAFQETAYSESSHYYLSGAVVDNWFAVNLRGDRASGLGRWPEKNIAAFLKTGQDGHTAAFGSMIDVIENSTQYLSDNDLHAIAHYLKSLSPSGERSSYQPEKLDVAIKLAALKTGSVERPGAGIYQAFCAKCHKMTGEGEPDKFPGLAGNSSVLSDNPISLIRLLLEGSETPKTNTGPKHQKMASYSKKLSDRHIAEVLSFIRSSWGNVASPVTVRDVTVLRRKLSTKP